MRKKLADINRMALAWTQLGLMIQYQNALKALICKPMGATDG